MKHTLVERAKDVDGRRAAALRPELAGVPAPAPGPSPAKAGREASSAGHQQLDSVH
ncbi:MAG: hypothetical protein K0S86_154 [Geminicoccaceae bacterium]|jgi:hypothetical protein|nr:hypothetical protein [Geminicoccaceae bacterium]